MVKLFYFKADLYDNDKEREKAKKSEFTLPHSHFYTTLNGERHLINVDLIEEALELHPDPLGLEGAESDYNYVEASRVIMGDPYLTERIKDSRVAPLHLWILHLIIC